MTILIKDAQAFAKIREAGRIASDILDMITPYVQAGVSTEALDRRCHEYARDHHRVELACLGYGNPPYPKATCISVNHVICHGIPSKKLLKNGDILNIDITIIKDGYHGDTSRMYTVGAPSILAQRLINTTYEAMWQGIKQVKPNNTLRDIAQAIEQHAKAQRFSVVREFCGHGIGLGFHEEPQVLHYVDTQHLVRQSVKLQAGMVFTIEPMINAGKAALKILPDQWTAVTKDRSLSAQWEHMVGVTETGYEIFTLSAAEKAQGIS